LRPEPQDLPGDDYGFSTREDCPRYYRSVFVETHMKKSEGRTDWEVTQSRMGAV